MNNIGFFDTGQKILFPTKSDLIKFGPKDMFLVLRPLWFFAKEDKVSGEKLLEYYTEKAIQLFENDGYITLTND